MNERISALVSKFSVNWFGFFLYFPYQIFICDFVVKLFQNFSQHGSCDVTIACEVSMSIGF